MRFLAERIADKVEQFYGSGKVVATCFLDPSEVVEVMNEVRYVEHVLWGGFDGAERRIIVIGAEEFDLEEQEFVSVIRIEAREKLAHRSVLGSVLGLGIKRELLGDIVICDNLCDIIVVRSIAEFVVNSLKFVGKEKVSVSEIGLAEMLVPVDSSLEVRSTVSSLRVDAVISAGFGVSREKSASLVKCEAVKVNHVLVKSVAKQVKMGDLISVRGKGRLEVSEVSGMSKSGRMKVVLRRK